MPVLFSLSLQMVFVAGLKGTRCALVCASCCVGLNLHAEEPTGLEAVTFRGQEFLVKTVDPKKEDLRLFLKDDQGHLLRNFVSLDKYVSAKGERLIFAANAGMFEPDWKPVGLLVQDGVEMAPLNLREGSGNFSLKPNGVFFLNKKGEGKVVESSLYPALSSSVAWATQSGPLLVFDGNIHPKFIEGSKNMNLRSGVGVRTDGTIVFAISRGQVNFYDFASLFLTLLKCPDALYLDGTISAFYVPGQKDTFPYAFGPMFGLVAKEKGETSTPPSDDAERRSVVWVPTTNMPPDQAAASATTTPSAPISDRVATLTTDDLKEFADQTPAVQALIVKGLELTRLNLKYLYGSDDPQKGGMDCSGTMHYLLEQAGLKDVPRDASGLYRWVWNQGHVEPVVSANSETFELDRLKPGDLLFWIGTYDVQHDPPVSHVMLYLGTNRQTGRRVMFGASEGRTYDGKPRYGVSVFDFKLSGTPRQQDSSAAPTHEAEGRFIGYGSIPGL